MEIPGFAGGDMYGHASEYFSDIFPDAIINLDMVPLSVDAQHNLKEAGLGAAEIIEPDGSHFIATYLVAHTETTAAISTIYDFEEAGVFPQGSHERAIDDIIAGTFAATWSRFISGQTE